MSDLGAIFKAYDVRGVVPDQWDATVARAIGASFVGLLLDETAPDSEPVHAVLVGHDMRTSSPALAAALAEGIVSAGVDAIELGLVATDELYFAAGRLGLPGVTVTASHNPGRYNGLKFCRAAAVPIGRDSGLEAIRRTAQSILDGTAPHPDGQVVDMQAFAGRASAGLAGDRRASDGRGVGSRYRRDVLGDYVAYLHELAPVAGHRLTVVVDAANGMGGLVVPAAFEDLDVDLVALYFDLDGTFPNHEANPLDPATLVDLRAEVLARGADLGLAFDGDADRCFVVDERGDLVSPSAITALVAVRELARAPGAAVIHNLICSRAVPEAIRAAGGRPVRTRVGHSYIKRSMADHDAVFGGEHSGHFYFRDFWYADSGLLAALHVLGALAAYTGPLSRLVGDYTPYVASGELNTVADAAGAIERVAARLGSLDGVTADDLDGLSLHHRDWWLNVRASNTEPMVRLNVEAADAATMTSIRDAALAAITDDRNLGDQNLGDQNRDNRKLDNQNLDNQR